MLGNRLRRWHNIKPALVLFTGLYLFLRMKGLQPLPHAVKWLRGYDNLVRQ